MQPEYYMEMKGIADATEIDLEKILSLNFIIEVTSYCTSIIARTIEGTIIHERNVDFFNVKALRDGTYVARFYKNN